MDKRAFERAVRKRDSLRVMGTGSRKSAVMTPERFHEEYVDHPAGTPPMTWRMKMAEYYIASPSSFTDEEVLEYKAETYKEMFKGTW